MPPARPTLTSFSAGELTPKLAGRTDISVYYKGCSQLVNFLIMRQGGLRRRTGTIYVANGHTGQLDDDYDYMRRHRLIPFVVDDVTGYVLEATPHLNASLTSYVWRVFYDHALVLSGGSAFEFEVGISLADIHNLHVLQIKEVMYLVSRDNPSHKITYGGSDTAWTSSVVTWAGPSLNAAGDYPGAIAFQDQRVILGSSTNNPNRSWGSVTNDFENMTAGSLPSLGVQWDLGSTKTHKIQWLESHEELVLGTNHGEAVVVGSADEGITPAKLFTKWRSSYGAAPVQAKRFQNAIVFVAKGSMQLREYFWQDGWRSPELTVHADHMGGEFMKNSDGVAAANSDWNDGKRGFIDFDIQQEPEPIIWTWRKDGKLAALVYDKESGVAGWSRMEFGGFPGAPSSSNEWFGDAHIGSACVIPNTKGEDELWLYAIRWMPGGADQAYRSFVEYMAPAEYDNDEDGHFVDCGIDTIVSEKEHIGTFTAAASAFTFQHQGNDLSLVAGDYVRFEGVDQASTWANLNLAVYVIDSVATSVHTIASVPPSGAVTASAVATELLGQVMRVVGTTASLGHLEGFTVAVNLDGMAAASQLVSSATISLPEYANRIHAGIPYTSKMKTINLGVGSMQGLKGRIGQVVIRFWKSLGGKVGKSEDGTLVDILIKRVFGGTTYAEEPHFTGDYVVGFPAGYDLDKYVYVEQSQPLPMHILAMVPDVYASGKG